MSTSRLFRPLVQFARSAHHAESAVAKQVGQTPTGFIHDGYASARLPFMARNKYAFAAKATLFLASGFWAPFLIVEYHLRKTMQ
uniref:Cytochrome c oxidase polypeptide VIIc n=1 Tax=Rhabditophanes sp. KR3021 TaxID=114890 RepID=A0AC35TYR8_9BILA